MRTVFDFVSIAVFAAVAVMFIQAVVTERVKLKQVWKYGLAGAGCALANHLGDDGLRIEAVFVALLTVAFALLVLLPITSGEAH